MSQISLDRNSLRIYLTAGEVRNFGFLSTQPHSLILNRGSDGSLEWVISSAFLRPGFGPDSVVVWIPPLPTSRESAVSSAASTTKTVVTASSYEEDFDPTGYSRPSTDG